MSRRRLSRLAVEDANVVGGVVYVVDWVDAQVGVIRLPQTRPWGATRVIKIALLADVVAEKGVLRSPIRSS